MKLNEINNWFKAQCNGDWEHENGVQILSTDNPGWCVTISLLNTALEGKTISLEEVKDDLNWISCYSDGKNFRAYCGIDNLNEVFNFFINEFIKKGDKSFRYEIYGRMSQFKFPVWRKYEAELFSDNIYVIRGIPDFDFRDLKFADFNDAHKIDLSVISKLSDYKLGDKVRCDLRMLADYKTNIIIDHV